MAYGLDRGVPVVIVLALVVLEMPLRHEAACAALVCANVRALSSVDANMRFQVAPLAEGLPASFKGTGEGLFFRLHGVLPPYMRPQMNNQPTLSGELLSAVSALEFSSRSALSFKDCGVRRLRKG